MYMNLDIMRSFSSRALENGEFLLVAINSMYSALYQLGSIFGVK